MIPTQGREKAWEVLLAAVNVMSKQLEGAGLNELGQERVWREELTRVDKTPMDVVYDFADVLRAAQTRLKELGHGQ